MVGAADAIKGELPVAFCVAVPGGTIDATTRAELQKLAIDTVGVLAAPARFLEVRSLPQTSSGKYLRRLLRQIVNSHGDRSAGTTSADDESLVNPESLEQAREAVTAMRQESSRVKKLGGGVKASGGWQGSEGDGALDRDTVTAVRGLIIQLAQDASNWQDARAAPSSDARDGFGGDQSTQTATQEQPVMDQPLMHLGFDSMRLVLFRDSVVRILAPEVTLPSLLSQLFGVGGLGKHACAPLCGSATCLLRSGIPDLARSRIPLQRWRAQRRPLWIPWWMKCCPRRGQRVCMEASPMTGRTSHGPLTSMAGAAHRCVRGSDRPMPG
eukprot:SAG25_NODE_157_length_13480_cov_7.481653_12_plen_326_part_00